MSMNYWLLLEKSDETRISKSIDGYQDETGELYRYDSLVPNCKNVAVGDRIVLRRENEILGVGKIANIDLQSRTKTHRRCPACHGADIRERKTMAPRYKCAKCSVEFTEPLETATPVISYTAKIGDFTKLNAPPSVGEVKRCAYSGDGQSSQFSILRLAPKAIQTLMEGVSPVPHSQSSSTTHRAQGFGLSPAERRAVERRAMEIASELYKNAGWRVADLSQSHPYDLLAIKDNEERYIEVKGTTGYGMSVVLTHGEVKHARKHHKSCALVVVSSIELSGASDSPQASGGIVRMHADPWEIRDSDLDATQYRYTIPSS